MRDINRIKRIISKLETAWMKYPDLRLTQLLINVGIAKDSRTWIYEDDKAEILIEKWLDQFEG